MLSNSVSALTIFLQSILFTRTRLHETSKSEDRSRLVVIWTVLIPCPMIALVWFHAINREFPCDENHEKGSLSATRVIRHCQVMLDETIIPTHQRRKRTDVMHERDWRLAKAKKYSHSFKRKRKQVAYKKSSPGMFSRPKVDGSKFSSDRLHRFSKILKRLPSKERVS